VPSNLHRIVRRGVILPEGEFLIVKIYLRGIFLEWNFRPSEITPELIAFGVEFSPAMMKCDNFFDNLPKNCFDIRAGYMDDS
jgi:hypothetical protein